MSNRVVMILIALATLFAKQSVAQEEVTFRQVDSITYRLYEQQQWTALIQQGKNFVKQGFDYYYLHLRLGIAYFHTHQYGLAEKYLKKAWAYNDADEVKYWLYFTYVNQGIRSLADYVYRRMHDKTVIAHPLISGFYPETGLKKTDNRGVGNMFYAGLTFNHRLGSIFRFSHYVNTVSSSYYTQSGYDVQLATAYKCWYINAGFLTYQGTQNLAKVIVGNYYISESRRYAVSGLYGKIGYTANNIKIGWASQYISRNIRYTYQYEPIDFPGVIYPYYSDSLVNQYIPSLYVSYTPGFLKNKLLFSSEAFLNTLGSTLFFTGSVSWFVSQRFWLTTAYLHQPPALFYYADTRILYQVPNATPKRLAFTLNYYSKNLKNGLKFTFSKDEFFNAKVSTNYRYNSFFIGWQHYF